MRHMYVTIIEPTLVGLLGIKTISCEGPQQEWLLGKKKKILRKEADKATLPTLKLHDCLLLLPSATIKPTPPQCKQIYILLQDHLHATSHPNPLTEILKKRTHIHYIFEHGD